ncbi:translocation/assembly module TamB domain-containing protein [Pelotalea chapellei]|uniref:Translocation/assembly module TamB domain-containing protein n=1 Tax=Pelotalea chapellei TaxID=44671 RepID=A0ABS5UB56_9BACT|nr:translocation/assembly module TamB domain-containing protein [Pelotalea chapellei]MBT1072895.1 translocation/assembly module TamB domain-containing protein [Pelotalea chapellei]
MKKLLKLIPITLLLALLLCTAILGWIVGTTNGARWLLRTASSYSGIGISSGDVQGRLVDRLHLSAVRIVMPKLQVEMDSLDLRWKPLLLMSGTLGINDLILAGVRVQDDSPPGTTPPDLTWPTPPHIAELFDATVNHLRIDRLSYRHDHGEPLILNSMSGSVSWQEMLLSISNLAIVSPSGSVSGSLQAGMKKPSLSASLAAMTPKPIGNLNRFNLQTRLLPARTPEQVAGSLTVTAVGKQEGKEQAVALTGELGMTRSSFNLRKLNLVSKGLAGTITGEGSLSLAAKEPLLKLQLATAGLDLKPLVDLPTDLNGTVTISGTVDTYKGRFDLANRVKGWQGARLAAEFQGNRNGLTLSPLTGALLDGSLQGNLKATWNDGVKVHGDLRARNINPARLAKDWSGVANFNLAGDMTWPSKGAPYGALHATILESRLHGQPLTGAMKAEFADDNLLLNRLDLQGKGFDLHADGELKRRLNVTARVQELSNLVPGASGAVRANGWLAWRDGRAAGEFSASGRSLSLNDLKVAGLDLSGQLGAGTGQPLHLTADARQLTYGNFQAGVVRLGADGTVAQHKVTLAMTSAAARAQLALNGAYGSGTWQGEITRFSGSDSFGAWALEAPVALTMGQKNITISPLVITSAGLERIELDANLTRNPLQGGIRTKWLGVKLSRADAWLKDVQLKGSSSGNLRVHLLPQKRINVAGNASAQGSITSQGHTIQFRRSDLTLTGDEHGLKGGIELQLDKGGLLKGNLASSTPARLELPGEGNISLEMKELDLALLRPWLPETASLTGRINGRATGKMLPGQRFELQGESGLSASTVRWKRPEGEMTAAVRTATARWSWRDEALSGAFNLALTDVGQAKGDFNLPLPARLPIAFKPNGPLQASLNGQLREKGIITAMFPALVQESSGDVDLNLKVAGQWEKPLINGTVQLARAAAYLPSAGIHVKDVQLAARVEKDLIRIDSFRARSGSGAITGNALLQLTGWQLSSYRGSINGDSFQTVYFPELQIQSSPQLTFEGTPKTLKVRGEVRLPEFRITGSPTKAPIAPSSDVILEGRSKPVAPESPLELDVQVRLVLGDRVLVKLEGIDAQLGGSMDIAMHSLDNITSRGEIKVVKGRYQTYGVNLNIERGRLFYAGGSISRPTLDFLALRTVGDVKAGVTVGGTLLAPVIKLYSDPAMPDVDILAYVVLGHPLGSSSGEQAGLMTKAAGVLLSSGQSAVLQDQIKSRLGLSTLEIQTAGKEKSGLMGYKPIEVAPPGTAPTTQTAGISQTMVTVGKYLTPKLYISYGRSIFAGSNLFLLRYDIYKNWQIETQTGTESGADLYYKIEFK